MCWYPQLGTTGITNKGHHVRLVLGIQLIIRKKLVNPSPAISSSMQQNKTHWTQYHV